MVRLMNRRLSVREKRERGDVVLISCRDCGRVSESARCMHPEARGISPTDNTEAGCANVIEAVECVFVIRECCFTGSSPLLVHC